jgi:hypothetical protein
MEYEGEAKDEHRFLGYPSEWEDTSSPEDLR